MDFDSKCYELAKYFLPGSDDFETTDLAEEIQETVENFLATRGGDTHGK